MPEPKTMPERHVVLVCGGRAFSDWIALYATLDRIHADRPITLIVTGAQRKDLNFGTGKLPNYVGADHFAIEWSLERQIDFDGRPARWREDGHPQAGPMRNQRQLDEHMPVDEVVAAPGNAGTEDMVKRARKAGVRIVEVQL